MSILLLADKYSLTMCKDELNLSWEGKCKEKSNNYFNQWGDKKKIVEYMEKSDIQINGERQDSGQMIVGNITEKCKS